MRRPPVDVAVVFAEGVPAHRIFDGLCGGVGAAPDLGDEFFGQPGDVGYVLCRRVGLGRHSLGRERVEQHYRTDLLSVLA